VARREPERDEHGEERLAPRLEHGAAVVQAALGLGHG
jgi:hypothetical protein